jgi:adenylate cyclase
LAENERRLAAIMFTDIAGYTAMTQRDESLAMKPLEEHRALVRPFF